MAKGIVVKVWNVKAGKTTNIIRLSKTHLLTADEFQKERIEKTPHLYAVRRTGRKNAFLTARKRLLVLTQEDYSERVLRFWHSQMIWKMESLPISEILNVESINTAVVYGGIQMYLKTE